MLSVIYAECHCAECRRAECHSPTCPWYAFSALSNVRDYGQNLTKGGTFQVLLTWVDSAWLCPQLQKKLEKLEGTNAIAYCENLSITDVKSFIRLTPERKTLAETENFTGKNAPKAK